MATKKINLGNISVEDVEVDGKDVILVSGKGELTLTSAKKDELAFTFGTGKNKATYIFEDHAVYNANKTSVSLIGSADDFSATKSERSKLTTINASQVDNIIELTGNAKANLIIAGDEGTTLDGGKGNDTLTGGDGADTFVFKNNEGNDLIRGFNEEHGDQISVDNVDNITDASKGKGYSFVFSVGKSKLTVEDASYQAIEFFDGKDTKIFKDGVFYAGNGKSVDVPASFNGKGELTVDNTVVTIDASASKKAVNLYGNAQANSIVGSKSNDLIYGGAGNDLIEGDKGNDLLDGGKGDDSLDGELGNDSLDGGDGNDLLDGGKGNDSLDGGKGDDSLDGGEGNDTLIGGADNDSLDGGKGNDKLYGDAGNDFIEGYDGNDTIEGGAGNDTLTGDRGNDKLWGDAGNDSIEGDDGNDSLYGGAGNDTLTGDRGNDKLWGGLGNDFLSGGAGNDSLWGDKGNDTFIYTPGDGNDVIYGFDNGDILTIDGNFSTATVSKKGKEVKLKIGAGSVTFKDFNAKTFHINNAEYQIVASGKNKWTFSAVS